MSINVASSNLDCMGSAKMVKNAGHLDTGKT